MVRIITTPSIIEDVLFETQLRYTETSIKQAALSALAPGQKNIDFQGFISLPGPRIIISKPTWWHLTPLIRQKIQQLSQRTESTQLASQLHEGDFYLVMVGCAFFPDIERAVEKARLSAYLTPQSGKKNPMVIDLYPKAITDQYYLQSSCYINLTNQLAFTKETTSKEETILSLEFKSLTPNIFGFVEKTSQVIWDFSTFKFEPIVDSRFCYLIVKNLRQAKGMFLTINITMQVQTPIGLLNAEIKEKEREILTRAICPAWIEI